MEMFIFFILALIILVLLYDNRKLENISNLLVDKYRTEQVKVKTLEKMFDINEDEYMNFEEDL